MKFINCENEYIKIVKDDEPFKASSFNVGDTHNGIPIEVIGDHLFEDNENLQRAFIPSFTTVICSGAFQRCTSLKEVYFSNSLEMIMDKAFAHCSALNHIDVPPRLEIIKARAFQFSGLTDFFLPNNTKMDTLAQFKGCQKLKRVILGNSISVIGESMFDGCSSLETINIPSSVTEIFSYAFANCDSLKEIVIPDSVKRICKNVFLNVPDTLIIKCNPGSYAEEWAREHGFKTDSMMSELAKLLLSTKDSELSSEAILNDDITL